MFSPGIDNCGNAGYPPNWGGNSYLLGDNLVVAPLFGLSSSSYYTTATYIAECPPPSPSSPPPMSPLLPDLLSGLVDDVSDRCLAPGQ